MHVQTYQPLDEAEYLALEARSPVRHEYITGEIFAMTDAGIRHNIIAGNLAFRQAATHSGDPGIETAFAWLQAHSGLLNNDVANAGYSAIGNNASRSPAAGQTWDAYWNSLPTSRIRTLATDASANTVSFIIDRMCANAGATTGGANCSASVVASVAGGAAEEGGEIALTAPSATYYRITVRIAGPRNTVSFVQAMVTI